MKNFVEEVKVLRSDLDILLKKRTASINKQDGRASIEYTKLIKDTMMLIKEFGNDSTQDFSFVENKIRDICNNQNKHGIIIDTRDLRGVGKSYSIDKIANEFGYKVCRKYAINKTDLLYNTIRGRRDKIILDEGFTLEEIKDAMEVADVVFAMWTSSYELNMTTLK